MSTVKRYWLDLRAPKRANQPTRPSTIRSAIGIIVIAAVGGVICALATSSGPLVSPDGAVYLGTADSLTNGRGLTVPFTTYTDTFDLTVVHDGTVAAPLVDFPPGFPLTIATVSRFAKVDTLTAARWTNITLLVVNLLLIGIAVLTVVGVDRWPWACLAQGVALLAQVGYLDLPGLLYLHIGVLAEPGMLACSLVAVLLCARYLRSQSLLLLIGATVAASAAMLFRFVGIAAVLVVAYTAIQPRNYSRTRRYVLSATVLIAALAPTGITLLIKKAQSSAPGRAVHLETWKPVAVDLFEGLNGLVTPAHWHPLARVSSALILLLGVCLIVGDRRQSRVDSPATASEVKLLVVFTVSYLATALASRLLFDRWIPLQGRLLTPTLVALIILATLAISESQLRHKAAVALVGAVVVALPGMMSLPSAVAVVQSGTDSTLRSDAMKALSQIEPDVIIITNAPDRIYLETGRPTMMVPCEDNYFSGSPNRSYQAETKAMFSLIGGGRAVLLIVKNLDAGRQCVNAQDASEHGLQLTSKWPHGTLFR